MLPREIVYTILKERRKMIAKDMRKKSQTALDQMLAYRQTNRLYKMRYGWRISDTMLFMLTEPIIGPWERVCRTEVMSARFESMYRPLPQGASRIFRFIKHVESYPKVYLKRKR